MCVCGGGGGGGGGDEELLGCRFWKFFLHCRTAFPTLSPSAAEDDEDDAIQDGQTDEQSHCEPHSGLHWMDTWQVMVIARWYIHTDTAYFGGIYFFIKEISVLYMFH